MKYSIFYTLIIMTLISINSLHSQEGYFSKNIEKSLIKDFLVLNSQTIDEENKDKSVNYASDLAEEEDLAIESWMYSPDYFNDIQQSIDEEELEIEAWMLDCDYFKDVKFDTCREEELEIEAWMYDINYFEGAGIM